MGNFKIDILPALSDNYVFIFKCLDTGITACIDPASASLVIDFLEKENLKLDYILNTHHHYDHISGNLELKDKYKLKIAGFEKDQKRITGIDIRLKEGDSFKVGNTEFEVIYVPGHTLGHIIYFSRKEEIAFVGDALFSSGCGRLFEGTADQMYNSLEKLKKLPADTKIYCAHEYTLNNIKFARSLEPENQDLIEKEQESIAKRKKDIPTIPTTISNELKTNPFLRTIDITLRKNIGKTTDSYNEEVFARIREMKDNF